MRQYTITEDNLLDPDAIGTMIKMEFELCKKLAAKFNKKIILINIELRPSETVGKYEMSVTEIAIDNIA